MLPQMGYFSVIRQLECVANSRYVTEVVCNAVPPRNRSINAALRLMQRITGLIGNLEVSIPIPRKKKLKKIFDITFELCKVLRERKRKTLIELLSTMTCLGNRTIQCPIHAGFYHAENITVVESLPPVLTESDFHIRFNWFLPKVASVLNITAVGRLYEIAKEHAKKRKYL
ncbi:uncharacterized protein Dvir_GJ20031 [Drosophila virilis]|uniref:Uncharacterized protein n=2 Tax=Drosophila virilis TaxID=7244 RepID=B4LLS8_DROVI|nr:uncharacterized protein LOC6625633 [Drosophila virilis]EDW61951.2 uncharacterized protein Dvir_GJ20031 [Drosophila virilis]